MPKIFYITTCMGRLDYLKQSLPAMLAQPDATCIVVDYSCPQYCGEWVEVTHPNARVVRVPGRTEFNFSHARNAGAQAAETSWLCFVDADTVLAPHFGATLGAMLKPGFTYHSAKPTAEGTPLVVEGAPFGPLVIAARDFDRLGGYDEAMTGWGYEDNDINWRIADIGLTRNGYSRELFRVIEHDDVLRVQHLAERNTTLSQSVNMIYSRIKCDLSRVTGQVVPLERRRELHAIVRTQVTQSITDRKTAEIRIQFASDKAMAGFSIKRGLNYLIVPPNHP